MAKADTQKQKKAGAGSIVGGLIGIALVGAFFLPTGIIALFGLLPMLIMAFSDRSEDRRGALAVGVLNIAGVIAVIVAVWQRGHTLDAAINYLVDPVTWIIMYGPAAIGMGIYSFVPKLISVFAVYRAQSEIAARRALQKKLVEIWGPDVVGLHGVEDETPDGDAQKSAAKSATKNDAKDTSKEGTKK